MVSDRDQIDLLIAVAKLVAASLRQRANSGFSTRQIINPARSRPTTATGAVNWGERINIWYEVDKSFLFYLSFFFFLDFGAHINMQIYVSHNLFKWIHTNYNFTSKKLV